MLFHQTVASFCSILLFTDPPEFVHLFEDQSPSAEAFIAPSQSKMVHLKGITIFGTAQRGDGSKLTHLLLQHWYNWMDIILVQHLLVEHLLDS